MTIKLEALVRSKRLQVFEINKGERNYLGFVNVEEELEEGALRDLALVMYSKTGKYLGKLPRFNIKVTKKDYNKI